MIVILLEIRISYSSSRNSVFNSATQVKLCRAGLGNWTANQPRISCLEEAHLILSLCFASSAYSETQGQSVGSREKARRMFHGANWNDAADSIRNVFRSYQ